MRVESCVCGGCITSPSLRQSAPYVEAHNATLLHRMWRASAIPAVSMVMDPDLWSELIPSRVSAYIDPRRRRPTAATSLVDVSGNTNGASAGDVEGRS